MYPSYAIHNGIGSTSDPTSYSCGGNLDTNPVALCQMPRLKAKQETSGAVSAVNTDETGISPIMCKPFEADRMRRRY